MEIKKQLQDDVLIIDIDRQIDSTTAPILSENLEAEIADGHAHLILDLSDVPYISSAGLRILFVALKQVRDLQSSGDMYLAGTTKTVGYAFRISGFDQMFCIYDTVDEAVAAMVASRDLELVDGDCQ
jgi:anti-anti-sigma factor